MGSRGCVNNGTPEDLRKSESAFTIFSDPSTLPHIVLLVIFSGSLYGAMSMDVFGSESQGAAIFVSLSLSYMVAALIRPSRPGRFLLTVESNGEGVLKRKYLTCYCPSNLNLVLLKHHSKQRKFERFEIDSSNDVHCNVVVSGTYSDCRLD